MRSTTPLLVDVVAVATTSRLDALAVELTNTTEAMTVPEATTERPDPTRRLKVFMLAIDTPPRRKSLPNGKNDTSCLELAT